MTYKRRSASRWERLWGVYEDRGYEAALKAWRLMPRTTTTVAWRMAAFARKRWQWLAGVAVTVLGWWIR